MSLWILFMSEHLNRPCALSDHCESVAWFINNGPHSAAYCYKLGPNGVNVECLCPHKATTIFQHTHATADCAWPRPPITRNAMHAVRTQCKVLDVSKYSHPRYLLVVKH